jgi:hypothetical protein
MSSDKINERYEPVNEVTPIKSNLAIFLPTSFGGVILGMKKIHPKAIGNVTMAINQNIQCQLAN